MKKLILTTLIFATSASSSANNVDKSAIQENNKNSSNTQYIYMMTYSSEEEYNHLSVLDLESKQVSKVADTNGGSAIEVVGDTVYVSASSTAAQGIWTVKTDGTEEALFNYVPMAGRLPIAVDRNQNEVYVGSSVNDSVLKMFFGNGDDSYPQEGEDYEFILDPIAEGCMAGCEPGAMFVDEENHRFYLAYGFGDDAKIISSTLGSSSEIDRVEEVTTADGFFNDTEDSIKHMEVDPKSKNIYFSNNRFIYKAKITGNQVKIKTLRTAPEEVVDGILGMTVDFADKKIYWSEDYNIYSSNLEGKNVQLILEHDMLALDFSIATR